METVFEKILNKILIPKFSAIESEIKKLNDRVLQPSPWLVGRKKICAYLGCGKTKLQEYFTMGLKHCRKGKLLYVDRRDADAFVRFGKAYKMLTGRQKSEVDIN